MQRDYETLARNLVFTANTSAVAAYTVAAEHYPEVEAVAFDDSDFFFTIAAVWTAASQLGYQPLAEAEKERLFGIVQRTLSDFHPAALDALMDFRARRVITMDTASSSRLPKGRDPLCNS